MSEEIATIEGPNDRIHLTLYAGPALPPWAEGVSRARVQLTDSTGVYLTMPAAMMDDLATSWLSYRDIHG